MFVGLLQFRNRLHEFLLEQKGVYATGGRSASPPVQLPDGDLRFARGRAFEFCGRLFPPARGIQPNGLAPREERVAQVPAKLKILTHEAVGAVQIAAGPGAGTAPSRTRAA